MTAPAERSLAEVDPPAEVQRLPQPVLVRQFAVHVPGPRDIVRAKLVDPLQLPKLYPPIHEIEMGLRSQLGAQQAQNFVVREKVKAIIPLNATYRAHVTTSADQPWRLRMTVFRAPALRIEVAYDLTELGPTQTRVDATVWFSCPWLARSWATQLVEMTHCTLLSNLHDAVLRRMKREKSGAHDNSASPKVNQ